MREPLPFREECLTAAQLFLGPLPVADVLDNDDAEARRAELVADERDREVCPDHAAILGKTAFLQAVRVALAVHELREHVPIRLTPRRVRDLRELEGAELLFAVAEEATELSIRFEGVAARVHQRDPNRRFIEERVELSLALSERALDLHAPGIAGPAHRSSAEHEHGEPRQLIDGHSQ